MSGATWIVTLVALGVRVIVWMTRPGLTYDGTYYLRQAERLWHGEYQVIGFPPGYPAAIALVRLVAGDFELAGRLVSLVAGTATVALFHVWARRKLSAPWALAAALFLALHPEIARTSVEILSEPLYVACITLGFLLFERRRDVVAGMLFGYAFLVRPEAIALVLGCAAWRVWDAHREGRRGGMRALPVRLLVAGLVPALFLSIVSTRALGHWVLTPKQGQFVLDAGAWQRLWTAATSLHVLFPWILVPGALVAGWRTRSVLLVGLVYLLALPFFTIHIQPRLLQPALPFLLLLGIQGLISLAPWWRRILLAVTTLLALWGASSPGIHLFRPGIVTPFDRSLGAALHPHLHFEDRVACRFPFVPYYAGAGFVNVPIASYVATMDSLVALHATHLLVLEHEVIDMLPQLRALYDDAAFVTAEGRLTLVTAVSPPAGPRALLYRFQPAAIESTRIVASAAVAAAWAGSTLFFVTRDGKLHARDGNGAEEDASGVGAIAGARDLCVGAGGTRVALVLEEGSQSQLGELDLRSGDLRRFGTTANDAPTAPTYVGDALVYVRGTGSGGLRALDRASGRVRPVYFAGLNAAEARPLWVTARANDVAVTYVRAHRDRDEHRIVATALWPHVAPGDTAVVLPGRWATQLSLADDAVAWAPGEDHLVGSIAIRELDEDGSVVGSFASLAVFAFDGRLRALSFGIRAPRRPVPGPDRIAFLSDDAVLRLAPLRAAALQFPRVQVFDAPRPGVQHPG